MFNYFLLFTWQAFWKQLIQSVMNPAIWTMHLALRLLKKLPVAPTFFCFGITLIIKACVWKRFSSYNFIFTFLVRFWQCIIITWSFPCQLWAISINIRNIIIIQHFKTDPDIYNYYGDTLLPPWLSSHTPD